MKKTICFLALFFLSINFSQAQSKFSYSILVNQSGSLDPVEDVCVAFITGGQCLGVERDWRTNVTLAANYELGKGVRLQSGLAYNVMSLDEINEAIPIGSFKIRYLSIPIRSHFFISQGKVSFYAGAGLRTDIRLNDESPMAENVAIQDRGRSLAVSMELLAGLEVKLTPQLAVNLEPTYSKGITSYSKDLEFNTILPGAASFYGIQMMPDFPQRMGVSLGITYKFGGSPE